MQTIKTRTWEDGDERRTISVGQLPDGSVCARQNTEGDLTQFAFGGNMHGAECSFAPTEGYGLDDFLGILDGDDVYLSDFCDALDRLGIQYQRFEGVLA